MENINVLKSKILHMWFCRWSCMACCIKFEHFYL